MVYDFLYTKLYSIWIYIYMDHIIKWIIVNMANCFNIANM